MSRIKLIASVCFALSLMLSSAAQGQEEGGGIICNRCWDEDTYHFFDPEGWEWRVGSHTEPGYQGYCYNLHDPCEPGDDYVDFMLQIATEADPALLRVLTLVAGDHIRLDTVQRTLQIVNCDGRVLGQGPVSGEAYDVLTEDGPTTLGHSLTGWAVVPSDASMRPRASR